MRRFLLALFVYAAAVMTGSGTPPETKLDRALRELLARPASAQVRVFVRGRTTGQDAVAAIDAQGAHLVDEQSHLQTATARVSRGQLYALASDPRVAALSLDAPVHGMGLKGDSDNTVLLQTIGIKANKYPEAKKVGVAIIDSGFAPAKTEDFEKPLFYDFTTGATRAHRSL